MSFLMSVIADATPPRIMRKSAASPAQHSAGNLRRRVPHSAHSAEKSGRGPEYHRSQPSAVTERETMSRRDALPEPQVKKQTSPASTPEPKMAGTPPDLQQRQKPGTPVRIPDIKPPAPETPPESSTLQGGRKRQIGESDEQRLAHMKQIRRPNTNRTLNKGEPTSQQDEISLPGPSRSMDRTPFDSTRLRSHQLLDEQELREKAGSLQSKAGGEDGEISPVKPATVGNDGISTETVSLPTPHNEPETAAVLHPAPISLDGGETKTNLHEDRDSFSAAQAIHPKGRTIVYAQHSDSAGAGFPEQQESEPGAPLNGAEKAYPEHGRAFHERVRQEEGGTLFQQPLLWPTLPQHDTPRVQIGQVNVIIEASHAPETRSAPAPENDFASRHFTRRL